MPVLRPMSHPRLGRAGTKLSYCNGENGAGSSNITPYMVWPYGRPRWVAQTLQQIRTLWVETERRWGESREQDKASAFQSRSAIGMFRQFTEGARSPLRSLTTVLLRKMSALKCGTSGPDYGVVSKITPKPAAPPK